MILQNICRRLGNFLHFIFAFKISSKLSDCCKHERVNPSNAVATLFQKHKDAKISENHPNPVMFVFMG